MKCMICNKYLKPSRSQVICLACDTAIDNIADCEDDIQVELALLKNPSGRVKAKIEDDNDYNDTESFSS